MRKQLLLRDLQSEPIRSLIFLAFIIQFVVLAQSIIRPVLIDILSVGNHQALERSAMIGFNEELARYIKFVIERTDENNFVLIPSRETHDVLGHVGIMQYFLIPRRISNCPINQQFEECFLIQGGPKTAILSVNGFPPVEIDEGKYMYETFNESWGIYIPVTQHQLK